MYHFFTVTKSINTVVMEVFTIDSTGFFTLPKFIPCINIHCYDLKKDN